jgi:hypothetical protein
MRLFFALVILLLVVGGSYFGYRNLNTPSDPVVIDPTSFVYPSKYEVVSRGDSITMRNDNLKKDDGNFYIFLRELSKVEGQLPAEISREFDIGWCAAGGPQGSNFCEPIGDFEVYINPNNQKFFRYYLAYIFEGVEYYRYEFGPFMVIETEESILTIGPTDFAFDGDKTSDEVVADIMEIVNSGR